MNPWPALLALLPACGFSSGDGSDGRDVPLCHGSYIPVCFSAAADVPVAPVTLPDLIDTDGAICNQHNDRAGDYCIVAGAGVTVPAGKPVRAFGNKPLVLLSTTTVALLGTVNASSARTGTHPIGAGANPAGLCTGTTPADHASGGFGGSFGGKGGDGEPIDTPRGTGGLAAPALTSFPTRLRGGCPGGDGSTDISGATPGRGGSGGGAVLVIARSIDVIGGINASGAGGRGASWAKAGGGGGGSGGMIVLDAPSITGAGAMFANGGGGGQGGSSGPAEHHNGPGDDGWESGHPLEPPYGGHSGRAGGRGGDGAAGSRVDGNRALGGAKPSGGGGGGGGAGGVIHAPGLVVVSPDSTDLP